MNDGQSVMLVLLATITQMEGGGADDCKALFAHVGGDTLPRSPGEAFAHVDAMREFVRARVQDRA